MSTNATASRPVPLATDDRPLHLRHVKPCDPWLSALIQTTPGVMRHYRFSEAAGTVCEDSTGIKDGTYVGAPTLQAAGLWVPDDAANYSVDFSGAGQYVTLPTMADDSAKRQLFTDKNSGQTLSAGSSQLRIDQNKKKGKYQFTGESSDDSYSSNSNSDQD